MDIQLCQERDKYKKEQDALFLLRLIAKSLT